MEGINLIPNSRDATDKSIPAGKATSGSVETSDMFEDPILSKNKRLKIVTKQSASEVQSDLAERTLFTLAILFLIGTVLYTSYLFFLRWKTLNDISAISASLTQVSSTIDPQEIEGFKVMDAKVKSIKQRLSKHFMFTNVFALINQNMRTTIQVSEYKVDVTDTELLASYSCAAPSFKEMAEQTERLLELKNSGAIKGFSLSIHANAHIKANAAECAYAQGGDDAFFKYIEANYDAINEQLKPKFDTTTL
jgi:multidrug resistance efflux pump